MSSERIAYANNMTHDLYDSGDGQGMYAIFNWNNIEISIYTSMDGFLISWIFDPILPNVGATGRKQVFPKYEEK